MAAPNSLPAPAMMCMSMKNTPRRAAFALWHPGFQNGKHGIDRRVEQMQAEGVTFHYDTHIGVTLSVADLQAKHDAIVLAGGSEVPRDLPVPGRALDGVHFAMDFLPQQNRRVGQEPIGNIEPILAEDKHVIVIGGGDTVLTVSAQVSVKARCQ